MTAEDVKRQKLLNRRLANLDQKAAFAKKAIWDELAAHDLGELYETFSSRIDREIEKEKAKARAKAKPKDNP